jgi:hypothetical protein
MAQRGALKSWDNAPNGGGVLELETGATFPVGADDFVSSHRTTKHQTGDVINFEWSKDATEKEPKPISLFNVSRNPGEQLRWYDALLMGTWLPY